MISRRKVALVSLLALSFIAFPLRGGTAQEEKEPAKEEQKEKPKKKEKKPRTIQVLFIGGSFIYYNNLPDIFAKLAIAGGAGTVETGMVASPGMEPERPLAKGRLAHGVEGKRLEFRRPAG